MIAHAAGEAPQEPGNTTTTGPQRAYVSNCQTEIRRRAWPPLSLSCVQGHKLPDLTWCALPFRIAALDCSQSTPACRPMAGHSVGTVSVNRLRLDSHLSESIDVRIGEAFAKGSSLKHNFGGECTHADLHLDKAVTIIDAPRKSIFRTAKRTPAASEASSAAQTRDKLIPTRSATACASARKSR